MNDTRSDGLSSNPEASPPASQRHAAYSFAEIITLLLFWHLLHIIPYGFDSLLLFCLGKQSFEDHALIIESACIVAQLMITNGVAYWYKPIYVNYSHWAINRKDLWLSLFTGYLAITFVQTAWAEPSSSNGGIFPNVVVCIVAPVLEEMLMRGVILRSLLLRLPNHQLLSVLVSALIAATLHKSYVAAFVSHLLLSILYVKRSNSLGASTVAHMCINTVSTFGQLSIATYWMTR